MMIKITVQMELDQLRLQGMGLASALEHEPSVTVAVQGTPGSEPSPVHQGTAVASKSCLFFRPCST